MRILSIFTDRLVEIAAVCGLLSLGALFSKHHMVFDLMSHFRVQYIVLLLPCFVFGMFYRKSKSVLIISLVLAIHGYVVTMGMLPVLAKPTPDYAELRVLNANLLLSNKKHQEQINQIIDVDPDVIVFLEYTTEWHEVLQTSLTLHPYRATRPINGVFGIALYSKFPITSGGIIDPAPQLQNVADVIITFDKTATGMRDAGTQKLRVIGVHPPPPITSHMYNNRNLLMQYVSTTAIATDQPLVVMGDFNATPWTAHFTDMLSNGGLRNARAGQGMHPTWPANYAPLWIPIDHVLVNDHIGVAGFSSARVVGSDHRNIWADIRIYQR